MRRFDISTGAVILLSVLYFFGGFAHCLSRSACMSLGILRRLNVSAHGGGGFDLT